MGKNDLQSRVADFIIPIHATIHIDQTVDEALCSIRQNPVQDQIFYFYVTDDEMHLKGVVSTRSLLFSDPKKKIHEIYEDNVIAASNKHSLQEAMEMLNRHRLLAVPVVDDENKLLGLVDIQLYLDEAVDVANAKRSSTDLFQVLGLTLEEGKVRSNWQNYKTRMPWIFCNMIGGLACAVISRIFEVVLLKMILLAMFIPLVLTLSESISMQSMTYSLQLLHRPRISWRRILFRVTSEARMVVLIALTCGVIVGSLSLLWGDGFPPAFVIATGISISVTIAGIAGAAIPLLLHARKLDPKVAAGPVVLMLADVITTAIYLSLATWVLL